MIDLHSREVIGYAVADHMRTSLIIEALAAAPVTRKPPCGVIFHSDHGYRYTPREFADFCAANGVRRSMRRRRRIVLRDLRERTHPHPILE
ncbi:MAG: DDE-type integrase/transposase/recombinase [Pseudonocardiaceae bacterium]